MLISCSLWDSFRSQLPFLTILDPKELERMIESLIDTYVHDGWLPDCRMSLSRGYTQGGSNADIVLADAYLKGLRGNIDVEEPREPRCTRNERPRSTRRGTIPGEHELV